MASIKKRGGVWRVQIRRKGFPSESATFLRKAQADLHAAERDAELTGHRHGIIPRKTVRQAILKYELEVCPKHRGKRWEIIRLDKILRDLDFADRPLLSVRRGDIAAWRGSMISLATSSARREYGLLRAVFNVCVNEWGWLKESPFRGVSPPAEGTPRSRRVSSSDAAALVAALGYIPNTSPVTASQFVACAFLLALETAMRQGEILSLQPEQVNAAARVLRLPRTKNGDARVVPLSKAALAIIELLPNDGYLFPVTSSTADTLFRKARKKAGLLDVHFHDSRREGTTRLAAKVDVLTLAKITGHKDLKILLRTYYQPSMSDVAALLD